MLQSLGIKKIFILSALVVMSLLVVAYRYLYIVPNNDYIKREVSLNQSQVAESREKINSFAFNYERLTEQKDKYDLIEKTDFFNTQDRLRFRDLVSVIKDKSGVLSAKYNVGVVKVESNSEAKEVGHKLLKTKITFDLGAIEDSDIYSFVFLLNQGFPGVLEIKKFEISRSKKLTQSVLKRIGAGNYEPLVNAKIDAVWWTLVPSNAVEATASSDERF